MSKQKPYTMGTTRSQWEEARHKDITFVVTENCNLACKYCYITGRNKFSRMSFEVAKKAVDYILTHPKEFPEPSVTWDFTGGEPFLEIDLIDQICDYIKMTTYKMNHKWFYKYRFYFSTNGLLYGTPKVQKYIKKNKNLIDIGISIDGNEIKHDLNRVKPDGTGSYKDIIKIIPLWQKQFPNSTTKVTFASADLPYLKDSIIHLWKLGLKDVPANVVNEDVWRSGDDKILEEQLMALADYIIEYDLWKEYNCGFFSERIGHPVLGKEELEKNWCGTGQMLAIDHKGNFFPCIRFMAYSLNNRKELCIGNMEKGINHDKLRPFLALNIPAQSPQECLSCEVLSGCAWCQGFNYDAADTATIYQRATYICKMHKARCRANEYFRTRLAQEKKVYQPRMKRTQHLLFLLEDSSVPHCTYRNSKKENNKMPLGTFKQGLEFARSQFYVPVLILSKSGLTKEQKTALKSVEAIYIHPPEIGKTFNRSIVVYDNKVDDILDGKNSILLINKKNLSKIPSFSERLLKKNRRVNIILENIDKYKDKDLKVYKKALEDLSNILLEYLVKNEIKELNVLTDRLALSSMDNCKAGVKHFALAPNGKFYLCPAFYFDDKKESIGSPEKGISIKNAQLLKLEKAPLCLKCDAYHCRRCIYFNHKLTKEYNTPSRIQCLISHIEREASKKLQQALLKRNIQPSFTANIIPDIDYQDPLELIIRKNRLSWEKSPVRSLESDLTDKSQKIKVEVAS